MQKSTEMQNIFFMVLWLYTFTYGDIYMFEENADREIEQNVSADIGAGYCIKVYVYPNGYSVGDPEPLEDDESAPGELVESQTDLLKSILAILKSNPVEPSESEGFNQSMADTQDKAHEY